MPALASAKKVAFAAAFLLGACSMRGANESFGIPPSNSSTRYFEPHEKLIKHVVIVIQENRSFDHLFATFPGAAGATKGRMSTGKIVALKKTELAYPYDFGHSWDEFLRDYNHGKMNEFDLEVLAKGGQLAGKGPYQYVDPKQIAPYWDIAKEYVLADHLFQTQGSGSYTAHQDLIRGGTEINPKESLIDFPSQQPWGCDSPPGTTTTVLTREQQLLKGAGPFPCLQYRTMRDLLDAKDVSWKYYTPKFIGATGSIWNAFDSIKAVRYGPEWQTNVTRTTTAIFRDISDGTLPAVSWVVPNLWNSDHPGNHSDTGPSWVASIVNAIGESSYWKTSAVIVVWDDWGGFYDNVPPPFRDDGGGLGFRVAMLVVSPYARKGHISHTQYEFVSILKFIENNWNLGRIGGGDVRSRSIGDCFDFLAKPRGFVPIPAKYSRAYFEHQPESDQPVDTE